MLILGITIIWFKIPSLLVAYLLAHPTSSDFLVRINVARLTNKAVLSPLNLKPPQLWVLQEHVAVLMYAGLALVIFNFNTESNQHHGWMFKPGSMLSNGIGLRFQTKEINNLSQSLLWKTNPSLLEFHTVSRLLAKVNVVQLTLSHKSLP